MNTHADDRGTPPAEAACRETIIDRDAVARVLGRMADERRLKAVADIFSALADPTRLRIVTALSAEPLCVCDIAEVVGVSQSAVSHQLRVLRDLDLVRFERQGKRAVYSLADLHVSSLLAQGGEHADERFGGT